MSKITLQVPDISCGHCKASIEGALNALDGVQGAEVHVEERSVDIDFDQASLDRSAIVAAIEGQGFEVKTD